MAVCLEDFHEDYFKICLRETKIFDGIHKNIKIVSKYFNNNFIIMPTNNNNILYNKTI